MLLRTGPADGKGILRATLLLTCVGPLAGGVPGGPGPGSLRPHDPILFVLFLPGKDTHQGLGLLGWSILH